MKTTSFTRTAKKRIRPIFLKILSTKLDGQIGFFLSPSDFCQCLKNLRHLQYTVASVTVSDNYFSKGGVRKITDARK
jgi:hypothetical protein